MRRPPSWSITRQYDGCEPLSYQRAKNVPLVRGADQKNTKKARPCHASPRPRYRGIVPYQTTAPIEGLVPCRAALDPCPLWVCAVQRRRFPVGASPTRQPLQPEAIGAVMEVTKWLKPSISVSRIGDS